jgi:hypothetical protein
VGAYSTVGFPLGVSKAGFGMMRRLSLSVAALGAAVFLASACGSSEDDPATGPGHSSAGAGGTGLGGEGGEDSGAGNGTGATLGSGGGSNGSGSSSGSGGSTSECASTEQSAKLTPANLLFVLDRSGSMNCNAPEDDPQHDALCETQPVKRVPDAPSKWEMTRDALKGALGSLVGAENVSVGVTVFPRPHDTLECSVQEDPDVDIKKLNAAQKEDIDAFLDDVAPGGKTPIAGATILSYKYLSEELVAGNLQGNTFVVLLTDGAETCTDQATSDDFVDTDVHNATLFNIKTFVIGAPGSAPGRSMLSEVAFNGLTPQAEVCTHGGDTPDVGDCHFDMTTSTDFEGDLVAALEKITSDKTLSCVFDVPKSSGGVKVDLNKVNVTFTPGAGKPVSVKKDDTEACNDGANGWQYSADKTKIFLCGDICDDVKADDDGEVRIVLGCPTEIVVK